MKKEIIKIVKKFYEDWGISPSIGFLAGYLKTSKQNILIHLRELEKQKKVKIIQADKHFKIKIELI